MIKNKKISFVIPVYVNALEVTKTYVKLQALFEEVLINYEYEIIFVNDGSTDDSLREIKGLSENNSNIKYISFSRNFGQVPAIVAGSRKAIGDMVVIMSADLQDPVELIEKMVLENEKGSKIVVCSRNDREDKLISRITSSFFYKLMKIANPIMPKGGFDFVLLDRDAVDEFNLIDERNRFFQGDILWLGYPIVFIPYKRLKREIGQSQWTISKKIKYFIDGLLNTSYLPIRLMSLIGIVISVIGFSYSIIIFYNRMVNNIPFDGWAPIMILILILGGIIMLMLGIIGEYVWRIYDETRGRKNYIIDEEN